MGKNTSIKTVRLACIAAVSGALLVVTAPASFADPSPSEPSAPSINAPRVNPAVSYQEGVDALQRNDCKTAERKFGEVLRSNRNMPEANYLMALAKVCLDKDKSSIRYFKRAIDKRSDFIEAREQFALASIRLGDTEEAESQLAALKDMQANCDANGCDDAKTARIAAAISKVETALNDSGDSETSAVTPENDFAGLLFAPREAGVGRYQDAVKLINQERYEDAIDALYASQAIIGPHPDILNYLGYSNRKLGRFDEAKAYYAAALKLAPDHLGATEYLGELYLELGEMGKARKQLRRLEALCAFGCAEHEDLARLIEAKESVRRAGR